MSSGEPVVSVIIPTLGRDSLQEAVASVGRQGVPVETIIVNDSGTPLPNHNSLRDARVIDTPGRMGAAYARNLGMRAATGDYLALLDDDDTWLRGHLREAVTHLARHPDADIYTCRGLVLYDDPEKSRIEPVELLGDRAISAYFFGHDAWRSRCRRILTSSLVFRRRLADLPMDPGLRMSEDTWWLLSAERERGSRMVQCARVGLVMHASSERDGDRSRQRRRDGVAWARRLDGLVPGAGAAFLASSRARTAVRDAEPGEVVRLGRAALALPRGWRWLPPLALQAVAASGLWVRRRIRPRVRS